MNKVIVITGAGGVLCSAFARALAADGHFVALLDKNEQAVTAIAEEINAAQPGHAIAVGTNVLDKENLIAARDTVLAAFQKIDVLINGAGGNHPRGTTTAERLGEEETADARRFFDLNADDLSFVFDLNCIGTLLPTQVFCEVMAENGGCVLNVSSMNAFRPLTKIPAYSAAKAAVSNLTQWLAVHFSKCNIRVNAIAPGFFVTNQNYALLFDESGEPTARAQKIIAHTPLGRFGKPEELLGAVRFLLDETQSGFLTGVVLPIDGGFSAYSGV